MVNVGKRELWRGRYNDRWREFINDLEEETMLSKEEKRAKVEAFAKELAVEYGFW